MNATPGSFSALNPSLCRRRGQATGVSMASHFHRWSDGTLHAKLALVVLAGVLVGVHIARPSNRALDGIIFVISLTIVWLGVALAH